MTQAIELNSAVLCVNCDVISDTKGERCGTCDSPSLLNLAQVLSRQKTSKTARDLMRPRVVAIR